LIELNDSNPFERILVDRSKTQRIIHARGLLLLALLVAATVSHSWSAEHPHIVVILVDEMGYGDPAFGA
jgi:hypothetical protein